MKRNILSLAALMLLIALLLSSCGGGSYTADTAYKEEANYAAAPGFYADSGAGGSYGWGMTEEMESVPYEEDAPQASAPDAGQKAGENDLSARKIIKNANVNFETTTYEEFLASLNRCVAEFGGYVETSETYGNGLYNMRDSRSASVTARIPAARYDAFMESVCGLGAVTFRSESKQDVTMNYVDTESHIRALETEYETLLEILEKAESLEDVITLQSRISELNYQMDSYKSQLRKYDDLISYCTVYIHVNEVWRETAPEGKTLTFGERIGIGLKENLYDIGEGFEDFCVWFVTNLPYLLIWAVVIAAFVLILLAVIRNRRKKKEKKIADAYLRSLSDETEKKKTDNNP
jgi:hypothetical protein